MGNLIRYIAQEDPEKELQNEKYSHRNFIESYVPQTPRRQQQTPTPWSKEALRRSTISERPKYTNPNPKPIPTTDIVKSGLELRVGLNMLLIHLLVIFIKELMISS